MHLTTQYVNTHKGRKASMARGDTRAHSYGWGHGTPPAGSGPPRRQRTSKDAAELAAPIAGSDRPRNFMQQQQNTHSSKAHVEYSLSRLTYGLRNIH